MPSGSTMESSSEPECGGDIQEPAEDPFWPKLGAGKVALITGAGSGMGAEAARQFYQLGASVALVDVNDEGLSDVGDKCHYKDRVLLLRADLAKDDDVKRVVRSTLEKFGQINILLNIAGILEQGGIESTTMMQFDRLFAVNIRAIYHLTMLCVPHLITTKGNVINISSANSKRVDTIRLVYSLTKVAVDHFTQSLAVELGPKGVRVNAINPGVIDTPMIYSTGLEEGEIDRIVEIMTPLKRMGTTRDISNALVFLASDDASYITGVTLSVDGGLQFS